MKRAKPIHREEDELLQVVTVRELSDYLRVHPSTVYRLVKTGNLPAFRVGDSLRFNLKEIEEWLEQSRRSQRTQKLEATGDGAALAFCDVPLTRHRR